MVQAFTEQFWIDCAEERGVTVSECFDAVVKKSRRVVIEGLAAQSKGESIDQTEMTLAALTCLANTYVVFGVPPHEALEVASKGNQDFTIHFDGEELSFTFDDTESQQVEDVS